MKRNEIDIEYIKIMAVVAIMMIAIPQVVLAASLTSELGTNDDFVRLGVFTVVAIVGTFAHYMKKWLRNEVAGNLFHYLVRDYPKQTVLSITTVIGTVLTMFLSHQIQDLNLSQLVLMSFTTGYAIDSVTNRGQDPLPPQ